VEQGRTLTGIEENFFTIFHVGKRHRHKPGLISSRNRQ
jgi:hypothetical protein